MNEAVQQVETPHSRTLDRSLVSGIAWTAIAKWATQLLSWASTLIVARLLSPGDFGLVGMATVYLGLIQIVNEFGLGAAILQNRRIEPYDVARLGGLSVLVASALCLLSLIVASPIAHLYREPAVATIIRVLSVTFVVGALEVVPRTLLTKELQFRRLAFVDAASAVTSTVTTLALAVFGIGYWALVTGSIVASVVRMVSAVKMRPHPLAWPRKLSELRGSLVFGTHIVVANVTWYAYRNSDVAIIGKILGRTALGLYDVGVTIAHTPLERVNDLVSRVVPPIFAAVQHDHAALRRYFLTVTQGVALVTFPAAVGIALVAHDFVYLVLGAKWDGAIVPLQILAAAAAFRSLGPMVVHVLVYTGHPVRNTQFTLTAAVVLPVLFYVGAHWGLGGVAMVWLVGYPLITLATLFRHAVRVLELRVPDYLRALWPASSGALATAVTVLALQATGVAGLPLAARFFVEVLGGAIAYGATLWTLHRSRLDAIWSVFKGMRGQQVPAPAAQ